MLPWGLWRGCSAVVSGPFGNKEGRARSVGAVVRVWDLSKWWAKEQWAVVMGKRGNSLLFRLREDDVEVIFHSGFSGRDG